MKFEDLMGSVFSDRDKSYMKITISEVEKMHYNSMTIPEIMQRLCRVTQDLYGEMSKIELPKYQHLHDQWQQITNRNTYMIKLLNEYHQKQKAAI